ncbi:M1-specific T cell receptor beta chain-like isoform 2-T2 [Pholidichthys leucotaenia]
MNIINKCVLGLFTVFLWTPGPINGSDVTQSPMIWKNQGDEATINCSHTKDYSYIQMYWYRQLPGENMKLVVFTTVSKKDHDFGEFDTNKFSATKPDAASGTFTVKNLEPGDKGLYFCAVNHCDNANEAHFGKGTKLTVLEKDRSVTPPTVKVIRPSPRECTNQKDKGKKKTIVCVASGFYPDHVSVLWKIDGENVTNNVATDEDAKMVGDFYRITSRLRVSREDYYSNPKKEFTCEVSFFNKTHTTYHSDGISSDEDKQTVTMTREKYLSITQSAKLSYGVLIVKSCVYGAFVCFLVWKLQGSGKPIK